MQFSQNWVKVCCKLFARINFDTLTNLVLSTVQALVGATSNVEERSVGYELLFGIIVVYRVEALRGNVEFKRIFTAMAADPNWRSRKRHLSYVQRLLEATKVPTWKQQKGGLASDTKALFYEMI